MKPWFLKWNLYLFSGDASLSIKPSTNVVVNQTVTLQCLFKSGQIGVLFNFPVRISCAVAFGYCARVCGNSLSIECPNNQTYILNVTVLPSWHNATISCEPPFGGIKSEITLNVTGMICTCLIVSVLMILHVSNKGNLFYLKLYQFLSLQPPSVRTKRL